MDWCNYTSRARQNDVWALVQQWKHDFKSCISSNVSLSWFSTLVKRVYVWLVEEWDILCDNIRLHVCVSSQNCPKKQGRYLWSLQQSDERQENPHSWQSIQYCRLYRRYKSEDELVVRSDRRNRLRTKHRNGRDCCWIEGAEIKKQRLPEFGSEIGSLRKYQSCLVPMTTLASVHRTSGKNTPSEKVRYRFLSEIPF
jgi:hypothetical protein